MLKNINSVLTIAFSLASFVSCGQDYKLQLYTTKQVRDSISIEVRNLSSDTLYFSIYKQQLLNKKWVSSEFDIFCDITNPNTTIARILPAEILKITSADGSMIYSADVNPRMANAKENAYRYMIKGKKKNDITKVLGYSNQLKFR